MTEEQGGYAIECARRRAARLRLPQEERRDVAGEAVALAVRRWARYNPSRGSWRTWISRCVWSGICEAMRRRRASRSLDVRKGFARARHGVGDNDENDGKQ
jgi:DNA-directed RNA polymerase specialized sigma24 family protein